LNLKSVIILCAGMGSRLKPQTDFSPKPLIIVRNKPMIDFIIENYIWNNFENFIIVLGYRWKKMQRYLIALQKQLKKKYTDRVIDFHYVINSAIERGNGHSGYLGLLEAVELNLGERVFVSMGDHLYSNKLIRILRTQSKKNYDIFVATEPRLNQTHIDIDDATKILGSERGLVLQIGKDIKQFNRIDMGVFEVKTSICDVIKNLDRNQEFYGWTDVVKKVIASNLSVYYCDMPELTWIDVDNAHDYSFATKYFKDIMIYEEQYSETL